MLYLIFSEEGGKKRMTPFMEWNLNCLRAIAELRTPLLDTLMQGVTELGGETLFMLFMLVVFWCVDKNKGYFLMLLCFTGTAVNQVLKITFCIPRPWVLDPSFEIVESVRAGASGDAANFDHAVKTAWTMLGLVLGAIVSVFADRHYTRFETQAVWWAQILKVVLGLALTLAVRVALKAPLTAAFGANSVGDGIRYFAVVLMAGTLWPMTFGWFSLMGRKK